MNTRERTREFASSKSSFLDGEWKELVLSHLPDTEIYEKVRTRVAEICREELKMPMLPAILNGFSLMLHSISGLGYDLNKKDQLARIFHPVGIEGAKFDLFSGEVSTGRIEATTRLTHEWVAVMYILEFMLESTKYGSRYSEAEWISGALMGLLHDACHPNGSHAGERAIRELVRIANGDSIYWSKWLRSFGLESALENFRSFGETNEERAKYWSHESMLLAELHDEESGIKRTLNSLGVSREIIELLKEQVTGKGLGMILDYCDTLAYLTLDYYNIKGYPFEFSNGEDIIQGMLSSIYFSKGFGWKFVPDGQGIDLKVRKVEELLALRARMLKETYKAEKSSIHEAMLQRMIVIEFMLGKLTIEDILSGGDVALLYKIDQNIVDCGSSLVPVLDYFSRHVILGKTDQIANRISLRQGDLAQELSQCYTSLNRDGLLTAVKTWNREGVDISDALSLAVFRAAQKWNPKSFAAHGAFAISPPFKAGNKEIVVDRIAYGAAPRLCYPEEYRFLIAISNPIELEEWNNLCGAIKREVHYLPKLLEKY